VDQLSGERRVNDRLSLGYLLGLAQQVQSEVTPLLKLEGEVPTLGLSAQINLSQGADRAAFLGELQEAVQRIAEKYGSVENEPVNPGGDENFRLILACYPQLKDS